MAERLIDGGFNIWASATDLTYWAESISGSSTINREATEKIEGSFSCRLDIDASNNAAYPHQYFYFVPGKKYKLIIRYKMSASGKTAFLMLRDSTFTSYLQATGSWGDYVEIVLSNSLIWKKYEIEFTANSSYSYYQLILSSLSAASSSIYFDKCSLRSIDKCGFLWPNLWDTGTLTANSEATNFPATNTRHPWHRKTYRSTGIASEWLKLDKGVETSGIQFFINRYNNFTSGATIKIQANSSDDWGSPPVDAVIVINQDIMTHIWAAPIAYRWWRHELVDAANPDGYLKAGRIYLGSIFEPERNFTLGGGMREPQDPSLGSFSESGQISSIQQTKFKVGDFFFDKLPRSDMETFLGMFNALGKWKDVFFCQDLGDPWNDTHYVRIASYSITPRYNDRFDITLQLEERR